MLKEMLKEMTMNEMMVVNGGYTTPSERLGTSLFERDNNKQYVNRFARDVVIILTIGGGALATGATLWGATIATGLAGVGDRLLNKIN